MSIDNISIDFKKLLPVSMRETRWGEFIEAYQSIIQEVKNDKINIIVEQFELDGMTDDDFKNLIERFGFTLSNYDGWTNTNEYFFREAVTLVDRILYKTTRRSFLNQLYIFNFYGDVYPLYEEADGSLWPYEDWWEEDENPNVVNILDSGDDNVSYYLPYTLDGRFELDAGQTLDQYYPVYANPRESGLSPAFLDTKTTVRTLDENSVLDYITRQILIRYYFKVIEDSTYFISGESARAFYNDVNQIKRATERAYFEPFLEINYNGTTYAETVTNYESWDETKTATQNTILLSGNPSLADTIQFGTGAHGTLTGPISGVANLSYTLTGTGQLIVRKDTPVTNVTTITKKLWNQGTMSDFSEIALFYSGSCMLYSKFPTVKYHDEMYANVGFEFTDVNL